MRAENNVVFAVIIAIGVTCIVATRLDYATGPVNVILILIVPLLITGLLCEAYLRRSENDDLDIASSGRDEPEDDELLDDEMLIHFDDYDDEDLDEDEEG